ncbi:hypothetical protein Godav_022277 [Gossypium davidsonii]|uniref:Uncharacterized protein n=1 Tax=Gossypium davidsonii TaxID=34287 RepID=A0A7J8TJV4_GOSDV|nr:hypothetical protein [Gossypium davidsonii]
MMRTTMMMVIVNMRVMNILETKTLKTKKQGEVVDDLFNNKILGSLNFGSLYLGN